MKVTEIKIKNNREDSPVKAYVSIVIDNCLAIHNIRIIESNNKMFVAFPSFCSKNSKNYYDVCHPINKETRTIIEDSILKELRKGE